MPQLIVSCKVHSQIEHMGTAIMTPAGTALLFDIDGTLADTDALHLEAFNQIFAPHGHRFDHGRFARELQGFSMASIRERFLGHEAEPRQLEIMEDKERVFRDLAAGEIKPIAGLMDVLELADRARVPMAAVTNAPRPNAEMILAGLGISHRFTVLVIGDELPHGKPHPLPYLEGLRVIGGVATRALAFEDSRSGVQSAVAAAINTCMRTSLSNEALIEAGASLSAKTYEDAGLLEVVRELVRA